MLGGSAHDVIEVLKNVRSRVRECVSVALGDRDALALALICGETEAQALLEFWEERSVRREALRNIETIALTDDEFIVIYGTPDPSSAAKSQRGARHKAPRVASNL